MATCSSCGRELPGAFPFCPFCGAALEAAPSAGAQEERKVVTCLFCDLVGFTSRAEQLDPEDVRALLVPYHARVRRELERRGGTVEKFIGDAVVAVFGAPVTHEDDPERAVRAALAIRDTARDEGLELRIGIATGEALVNLAARPAEGEGLAAGDVVNTAARVQSAAPVNGILVGEGTYRATRRVIEYRDAGPVQAKGKAEPVSVWEVVEARSRFGTEVLDHVAGELVGREHEVGFLRGALRRVRDERSSQLVTLVGVPGIGKSRLLYELSSLADAEPELIGWRQGRCLAYGDGVTFWALAEIVKAHAGIQEADGDDEAAAKLRAVVDEALADTPDAAWVEGHLRPLAGLGDEAELAGDRRSEAFSAWRRFFEALAEQRPLVLVFEDLQWADDGLLDFVDELADWTAEVPLLVVCTARPELLSRRPGWGGGKLNATTLALGPLSDTETARLLSRVLDRPVLPAATQQTLLERAGGNPLYAEQFALLYQERGSVDDLSLPESLQGIVAARLDGLSPAEKALLQDAAVVGKVFWTGCLQRDRAEAEPLLHELARKGFVRPQRRSSVAGESEHAFAHVLVRDVAYAQIPRGERADKHRQVAEWMTSLGRSEDHAEMVAHHWRAALEFGRAAGRDAGDVAAHARLALRDAGDRAFALNAYAASEAYYSDALALWPEDDAERADLLFRRARSLHVLADDRRQQALEEARDALVASGARSAAAEACAFLARGAWHRGATAEAFRHLARAEELVVGEPPSAATARVLATAGRHRVLAGEEEHGAALAREALAIAEELGLPELRANALTTIGTAAIGKGPQAREALEQALAIAVDANSRETSNILINLAVEAVLGAGDIRREDELFEQAIRTAERYGDRDNTRFAIGDSVYTRWALGDWADAMERADGYIRDCEASPHYLEGLVRSIRATMRLARGNTAGAAEDIERSLELAEGARDPQSVVPAYGEVVYSYTLLGRVDEARVLAQRAFAIVREHGYFEEALALQRLAFVADQLEVRDELRALFETAPDASPWKRVCLLIVTGDYLGAAEVFAERGALALEAEVRLLAAEQLAAAGRHAEAQVEVQPALAFFRRVGATAFVHRVEALQLASA